MFTVQTAQERHWEGVKFKLGQTPSMETRLTPAASPRKEYVGFPLQRSPTVDDCYTDLLSKHLTCSKPWCVIQSKPRTAAQQREVDSKVNS